MRDIDYLVVHYTASHQDKTVWDIAKGWFKKGWKNPGYHILISPDGTKTRLLKDEEPSNGAYNYNQVSLHVCTIGGIDANGKSIDNRTDEQKAAIIEVLTEWRSKHPKAEILGHRDFFRIHGDKDNNTACPGFDAVEEYAHI
jgi:N-acetylmuramoyl-L-alanine amidase